MTVTIRMDVDDERRRRIRAAMGRGGMATRAEVKAWVDQRVELGVLELPAPKRRGRAAPAAPATEPSRFASRFEAAKAASELVVCRHCGTKKLRHGKMGFTCPPMPGRPKGRMFEAEPEVL